MEITSLGDGATQSQITPVFVRTSPNFSIKALIYKSTNIPICTLQLTHATDEANWTQDSAWNHMVNITMQRLCIKIINNNGHNFLRCWNDAIWATKWNIQEDQILCKWIVFIFLDKHQTTIQQQHVMQWTSITYTAYQLVPLLSRKQSIPYVIWRQTIKATILEDSDTLSFLPPLAHFEKKLEEETNLATYE